MATVYLARDLKHDRLVAVKVLRSDLAAVLGPDRFLQEIRLTARLQHPHLLTVLDSGESAGLLWFTMPFVEGETLRARLDRERELPLADALTITRNVAGALTCAHRHGITHRDVKPANILLEDGEALLADFGIARALAEAGAGGEALTATGLAVGTPSYMSPEQAAGEREVDGRADVYALGCVLYEMLAGEPPYTGPTAQAIVAKRFADPVPSIRRVRPEIPATVDTAIQRALARRPADRFATPEEFTRALDGAPAVGRKIFRDLFAVAAGLALLVVAIWSFQRRSSGVAIAGTPALAVLPFRVSDPAHQLWREGLVDLFSLGLDGAGDLRTIHPRTVLSRWNRMAGSVDPDETAALTVARDLGARYALTGTLLNLGSRMRLVGELYDLNGKGPRRVQVEGPPDSVPGLADRLAIALLREGLGSDSSARPRATIAEVTTTSLPALKAYLSGEQKFRRARPREAAADFERAVQADSTFTLAEFRQAAAKGWSFSPHSVGQGEPPSRVIAALSRLPRREALLIRGAWELAQERQVSLSTLDTLVRTYPADAEAWYMLGDAYFHIGMLHGITTGQVENALRRAVALDSSFAPAYLHLTELAFDRLDSVGARQLIAAVHEIDSISPKAVGLGLAWDLAWGDSAGRRTAEALLQTADGDALLTAKHAVNLTPDLAVVADRIASAMMEQPRVSPQHRLNAKGGLVLSYQLRGHLRADLETSAGMTALSDSVDWTYIRFWSRLSPGLLRIEGYPVPGEFLERANLPAAIALTEPWHLWMDGLAALATGRVSDLHRDIATLQRMGDTLKVESDPDSSTLATIKRIEAAAFANALLGYEELHRGDRAGALAHLSAAAEQLRPIDSWVTIIDYQLGREYLARGDYDNAYKHMLTPQRWATGGGIELIVPREFYLGQIAEGRGDRGAAREHYGRFVRWWRNCDPELRPWWEEGRRGLARVSEEPGVPRQSGQ
jgi:serine/threonine-protein kinase